MAYRLSDSPSTLLHLIRGASTQAVLVGHLWSMLGLVPALQPPRFAYIQNVAVVVFFVLSGFLITYASLKPGYTFGSFFADRFARIYTGLIPALLLILGIDSMLILLGQYGHREGFTARSFFGSLLMLQDYVNIGSVLGVTSFGSGRVLWTLAVEWWLYMLFGWVLLARATRLFWPVLLLLLPVPMFHLVNGRGHGLTAIWLLGAAAFLVLRQGWLNSWNTRVSAACAGILFVAALLRLKITREAYDVLFAALLTATIVFSLRAVEGAKMPLAKPIRVLADYSFTLYLVHLSVAELVIAATELGPWITFWLALVVANCVAYLIAVPTEMQHKALARALKKSPSRDGTRGTHPAAPE